MIIQRRNFLIGLASMLAAPAIVRAENIMPVRALILPPTFDPLVNGIRWQSWPIGTLRPPEFCEGSIGHWDKRSALKPHSYWMTHLEKHAARWPVYLKPDPDHPKLISASA